MTNIFEMVNVAVAIWDGVKIALDIFFTAVFSSPYLTIIFAVNALVAIVGVKKRYL